MKFLVCCLFLVAILELNAAEKNSNETLNRIREKRQLDGLVGGNVGKELGKIRQGLSGRLEGLRKQFVGSLQKGFGSISQGIGGNRQTSRRGGPKRKSNSLIGNPFERLLESRTESRQSGSGGSSLLDGLLG